MFESTIFHKSIRGASHILSGKPCQDYSDVFQDEDIKIVVVSDGHGGSSYFRSDVGARIATDITIQFLTAFARCVPSSTFEGLSFSITAQPQKNPFLDADGNKLRFEELSDDKKKLALQAQSFFKSEEECPRQQAIVKDLLSQIYKEWTSQIELDARRNPFSREEKKALSGQCIEKAYGCTLLAFLQTKNYWLSFQIGDGRILSCDQFLNWREPVPEDCACFLNYTTSLCDSNPLIEFRYAFNGKDEPPLAVILCSDGVDGSLGTDENLYDFYEQIIGLCIDGDVIEMELESYLPSLSESGNKDDLSLSGIISLPNLNYATLRMRLDLKKRLRNIRNDYRNRKNEIEEIVSRIDVLKMKFERAKDNRFNKQVELDEILRKVKDREKEVQDIDQTVKTLKNEIETLESNLKKKESDFESWKFSIKNEMADLESAQNETDTEGNNQIDYTKW